MKLFQKFLINSLLFPTLPNRSQTQSLASHKIREFLHFSSTTPGASLAVIHMSNGQEEIYFLCNRAETQIHFEHFNRETFKNTNESQMQLISFSTQSGVSSNSNAVEVK